MLTRACSLFTIANNHIKHLIQSTYKIHPGRIVHAFVLVAQEHLQTLYHVEREKNAMIASEVWDGRWQFLQRLMPFDALLHIFMTDRSISRQILMKVNSKDTLKELAVFGENLVTLVQHPVKFRMPHV